MKTYTAYHWSRNDDCLGYGDGRQIVLGETLEVNGNPSLCNFGLHGSVSIVDALGYASGSHLWLVEIWGNVDIGDDKICGTHRKALIQYGDLLHLVVEFAYWCANRAARYAASVEYAEYAAKSAVEYAKYAAKYAKYAAKYAKSAAKSSKYAKSAAKYAKSAAKSAYSAAKSAYSERIAQEDWWNNKLSQIRTR